MLLLLLLSLQSAPFAVDSIVTVGLVDAVYLALFLLLLLRLSFSLVMLLLCRLLKTDYLLISYNNS